MFGTRGSAIQRVPAPAPSSYLMQCVLQINLTIFIYIHLLLISFVFSICLVICRLALRCNPQRFGLRTLFAGLIAGRSDDGRNQIGLVVPFEFADGFGAWHEIFAFIAVASTRLALVEKLCRRRPMGAQGHRLRPTSILRSAKRSNTIENI